MYEDSRHKTNGGRELLVTPWRAVTNGQVTGGDDPRIAWIEDGNGTTVVSTDSGRINADPIVGGQIVRCVNAYELLRNALVDTIREANAAMAVPERSTLNGHLERIAAIAGSALGMVEV